MFVDDDYVEGERKMRMTDYNRLSVGCVTDGGFVLVHNDDDDDDCRRQGWNRRMNKWWW